MNVDAIIFCALSGSAVAVIYFAARGQARQSGWADLATDYATDDKPTGQRLGFVTLRYDRVLFFSGAEFVIVTLGPNHLWLKSFLPGHPTLRIPYWGVNVDRTKRFKTLALEHRHGAVKFEVDDSLAEAIQGNSAGQTI